jgi:HNH endonuclease
MDLGAEEKGSEMLRCLFCPREEAHLTDEHVFPAALGGNLTVNGAVCAECNNGFSRGFEQYVVTRFAHFRRIFLIPDRYGRVPEVVVTAQVDGQELEAKLLRDGNVQLKPIVSVVPGEDGAREFVHQHVTENQKEKLRQEAKQKGFELIEETVPGQEAEISLAGDLDFLDAPEMLRNVAKIAYTALAFRMGRDFAMKNVFDELRTYVRSGTGSPKARLFLNDRFFKASEQGPHQHSVVIACRHDNGRVDAIVRLFGGLSYFVNLAEQYEGADFASTLVYNAQQGEINGVLVSHLETEFLQVEDVATSKDTIWDNQKASGKWFLDFVDQAIKSSLNA